MDGKFQTLLKSLHWLGHDSFRLDSDYGAIYFDPYGLKPGLPLASLLLLSHDHFDHYSPPDLEAILTAQTIICAPTSVAQQINHHQVQVMAPGSSYCPWPGVEVRAVPSYNLDKAFHPKISGWLGFILNLNGISIYHAGDTDFIPEMHKLRPNIALLPVSGTYTMNAQEAVQAALAIEPGLAIPMHYGSIVGTIEDAQYFAQALEGKIPVKILEQE